MRRPEVVAVVAAVVLAAGVAGAAPAKDRDAKGGGATNELGLPFGAGGGKRKEPITITSDGLEYDYKGNVVTYRGNVLAVQGDVKVKSDLLIVTLAPAPKNEVPPSDAAPPAADPPADAGGASGGDASASPGGGKVKVQTVTAVGNVRIDQTPRWATGGRAVFDQQTRTMVLSENPVLHDGPNEVVGDRVVVYLDENRSVVEGGSKRVKAVLHPDKGGGLAPDAPVRAATASATPTTTTPPTTGATP